MERVVHRQNRSPVPTPKHLTQKEINYMYKTNSKDSATSVKWLNGFFYKIKYLLGQNSVLKFQ